MLSTSTVGVAAPTRRMGHRPVRPIPEVLPITFDIWSLVGLCVRAAFELTISSSTLSLTQLR
nr:MAG TPA: hypothetical protein [Caudoviricetes sp.]